MPGTSSIGGLVSGLDTASLIDQLISVSRKRIDVVVANQTEKKDKIEAYQGFNLQLTDLQSKAKTLRNSDTFNVFKTSTSTNSTNFSADNLVTVTTTTDASPGTHTIEFTAGSQLAQARQISSQSFSSFTDARNLSGEFLINGKVINVISTDTLADIAVKINNANSGANATKVTASVISVSTTDNRLILTSDETGKDKFNILAASSTDLLSSLGFTSGGTAIKNTTSDGATSDEFSNSQTAVGSLLSLTNPQNNTVTIAGQALVINLSTQSLTTIAGNINGLTNVTASVVDTTTDGVTTYKIDISGTTSFTDADNILETLGILKGVQSSVAEVHTASTANNKISGGGGAITSATTFDDIDTGGGANNVANNDTITISGTDHDGNAVTGTYTITDRTTDTVQGLLTAIQDTLKSVDATNTVTATINGSGQIVVTDTKTGLGDSQLTVNIIANNQGNGTLDFGAVTATTEGYSMQTTAGQDAKVKIDGVAVTRSSNSIDDVISGVTVDVSRVESGSTVNVTVSRDTDSIKNSVNDFITQYNSTIDFINKEFKFNEDLESAGILSGETTLSSIKTSIQSIITGTISLLPAGSNAISLIGITSDSDGKLTLKDSTFLSEINSDFNAVKRMFIAEGTATNSEVTYIGHTKKTSTGDYDVNITQAATKAGETGETALTSGIGAGNKETIRITDTASGRVATISLDGDASQNGSSIDNIVNAINSELDTQRTQTLAGSVVNTAISTGLAITSSTKFNDITGAGLSNNDTITYTGTTRQGISVSGSYTISDVTTNTVQNFLSAIEEDFDNAASATINSSGNIVLTDNTIGDSLLSITITEPASLNFGTVLTTNTGGVAGRYAMEITASKDSNDQLVITNDNYGSAQGFTISQVAGNDPAAGNEVITGNQSNTLASDGVTKIAAGTTFGAINTTGAPGNDITNSAIISYSGTDNGGTAKSGSYTIADKATNTVQNMLTQIETDFGLTAGSLTISNGQIFLTDDTAGVSQLGISFTFDTNAGGLTFGTFASQNTGVANGAKAGADVAGTINGEAATGTGQLLKGNKPGTGESSSIEGLAIKVTSTNESLVGSVANTAGSSAITSATLFSAIDSAGVVNNDTITISGTKHDGTAVSYTYTITAANQVNDLLTSIETNFGLSGSAATINSSGKIAINDTFTGSSQLSINLVENNEGGGSLDFGTITPGAKGKIKLTMGVAETMYNKLLTFTDPIDGLLTIRIDGLGDTVDNLQETIDGMNERLAMESLQLNNKFVQLELSLSKLQNVSSFLAQQLSQLSK